MPGRDPKSFIEDRNGLATVMLDWSNKYQFNYGFRNEIVPDMLDEFYSKMSRFRNKHIDTKGVSYCFQERCDILRTTVEGMKILFQGTQVQTDERVRMLKWTGIEIGRLRLDPRFGEDPLADEMDDEADHLEMLWNPNAHNRQPSIRLWHTSTLLSNMWMTIHFPVSGCLCVQCTSFGRADHIPRGL